MTSANAAPSPPSNSRLRLALIASLALNVLIIGAVAGTFLMSSHQGWGGHKRKQFGLMGFAQTLPADRAEIIRAKIASEEANLAPLRKAERDARDAARAVRPLGGAARRREHRQAGLWRDSYRGRTTSAG